MVVDRSAGQRRQRRAGRGDPGVARRVGISHDGVGIGDVEVVADQRHTERRVQMIEKDAADFGYAIAVAVTQQRDAVARAAAAAGGHP
jgi:hypothetical protein